MVNFMVYEFHFNLKNGKRKQRIFFKLNNIYFCAYFWLCSGFLLVAMNRGYSLVEACGLLTVMAFLIVERGLEGTRVSVVVACGLRSCDAWA